MPRYKLIINFLFCARTFVSTTTDEENVGLLIEINEIPSN